ncbi:MAG: hypothetical protein KC416_15245, partial [Myxococcales bacterium]|nr:hypothetical protein [Myxococcales bacterium]
LADQRTYVVAIRNLRDTDGQPVPAPSGFRDVRDNTVRGQPVLRRVAAHYDERVWPVLSKAKIDRQSLQLAWDFTTRSYENAAGPLEHMRAEALALWEESPPSVAITKVEEGVGEHIARRIEGTIEVPLYLTGTDPTGSLVFEDGLPVANTTARIPFLAIIPNSVAERSESDGPARLLQFGHGIFGSREEIANGFVADFADRFGYVVMAVDWWGMSQEDTGAILDALVKNPSLLMRFMDRVPQAMVHQLALAKVAQEVLPDFEEFSVQGKAAYDPDHLFFLGISLGHIFGATYVSLSPKVERAALHVGGANFSYFLLRSSRLGLFLTALEGQVGKTIDLQLLVAMTQGAFDRADGSTFASRLHDQPFDDAPRNRPVLFQMGLGDVAVPNIGTAFQARTLGLPVLSSASTVPPLLETAEPEDVDSALAIFDFGIDPLPGQDPTPPTNSNRVHDDARLVPEVYNQIGEFLRVDGTIKDFCDTPCVLTLPTKE